MPCSIIFSMTLQIEILSIVTSDFLKQMIFLKSFNSVISVLLFLVLLSLANLCVEFSGVNLLFSNTE